MKRNAADHPKLRTLADELASGNRFLRKYAIPVATGILERLWHFTAKYSPQGDLGKHAPQRIAEACGWPTEDSEQLITILLKTGWLVDPTRPPLDPHSGPTRPPLDHHSTPTRHLLVKDWNEHADESVKKWLKKQGLPFFVPEMFRTDPDSQKPEAIARSQKPEAGGEGDEIALSAFADPSPDESESQKPIRRPRKPLAGPTPEQFVDAWNSTVLFSQIKVFSEDRIKSLNARRTEAFWREHYAEALAKIPKSPFLRGENDRGWKADAEWFLRPGSLAKILEGKYDGAGSRTGNGQNRNGRVDDEEGLQRTLASIRYLGEDDGEVGPKAGADEAHASEARTR